MFLRGVGGDPQKAYGMRGLLFDIKENFKSWNCFLIRKKIRYILLTDHIILA